jgi:toxoflavin biosynthesis protein ToxC
VFAISVNSPTRGHGAPITDVRVAPDGHRLATASYDGTVIVWSLDGPVFEPIHKLKHRRLVNSVSWNPKMSAVLASASADKTIGIWDVSGSAPMLISTLSGHTDDVNSVCWFPDGRTIAAASEDFSVSIWDSLTGHLHKRLSLHTGHCMMVDCSPEGLLATVGEDGRVAIYSQSENFTLLATRDFGTSIEACKWSSDGEELALARDDGSVEIVDKELMTKLSARVSTTAARSVSWGAAGSMWVGTYDGSVLELNPQLEVVNSHYDARLWPRSISVSNDFLFVGSFGTEPFVFDLTTPHIPKYRGSGTNGPNAMVVKDGRCYVGTDSGTIFYWDFELESSPQVFAVLPHPSPILSMCIAAGELFLGTYAGEVVGISLADPEATKQSERFGAPIPSIGYVDGFVVAGTYDGELLQIEHPSLKVIHRNIWHSGSIKSISPLSDSVHFAAASTDRTASIGDILVRQELVNHGNLINSIDVAGDFIVTGSRDHTVKVTQVKGRVQEVGQHKTWTLLGSDESVKAVGIREAGDGLLSVVAGSYDFCVYEWSIESSGEHRDELVTGQHVATMRQAISCISSAAEGFIVASWDRTLTHLNRGDSGHLEIVRSVEVPMLSDF